MGISPGGRPIDESPLSSSKTDNWVARAGGLPPYIRGVARGIAKNHGGKVTSRDIKIAIGKMKVWAAGGDNVTPPVQAAAAKALAEWEALRAKAHADLAHDIVHGLIDLAAVNKHHVPGTAYHWKHGYIPLDARTATLWKKKHFAERLTREGKLTTHEPEGIRNETDRRNAYATRELGIEAVKREAVKVIAAKPEEPKTPETPKGALTKEARAAAKDYVEKYRLLRVANEKRTWDTSKHENAVDEAAKVLKTQHGIDVSVPEAMPKGQSTIHSNGVETVTYTTDDYAQSRKWRETHEANVTHLHELSGAPAPKSRYGTRYGWKNSDLISLRSHLGKDPNKVVKTRTATKADTRTPAEVLANPQKGDEVHFSTERSALDENGNLRRKYVYNGKKWVVNSKRSDGEFVPLRGSVFAYDHGSIVRQASQHKTFVNGQHMDEASFDPEAAKKAAETAAMDAAALKAENAVKRGMAKATSMLAAAGSPEGWSVINPIDDQVSGSKGLFPPDKEDIFRKMVASGFDGPKSTTIHFRHKNGATVAVSQQKKAAGYLAENPEALTDLLNTAGQAYEDTKHMLTRAPTFNLREGVVSGNAWAHVSGSNAIASLGHVEMHPQLISRGRKQINDPTKVAQVEGRTQMYHTLIHELGHVHDAQHSHIEGIRDKRATDEFHTSTWRKTHKDEARYGKTNTKEGYAEAFTQYVHEQTTGTHGQHGKHSAVASAYAQRFNWKSRVGKEMAS